MDATQAFHEWVIYFARPTELATAERLKNAPELPAFLGSPEPFDLRQLTPECFGVIGDGIPVLTSDEFAWLFPMICHLARQSGDPVFALTVVQRSVKEFQGSARFQDARRGLSLSAIKSLHLTVQTLCCLAWDDDRRLAKWTRECLDLFLPS